MPSSPLHPHPHPLPLHPCWSSPEEYVESLLSFVTHSDLFRTLCGGVHVLDFLTRKPDLYTWVLPKEWRDWFEFIDIHDLLFLLLREDLSKFSFDSTASNHDSAHPQTPNGKHIPTQWRDYPQPPNTLISYIRTIREHSLVRDFEPMSQDIEPLPAHISVGMKPKKIHEVTNFAAYVDRLSKSINTSVSISTDMPVSIIDFGSGQNYLGRILACPPYGKDVIAIEQRHHNVEGAKGMDVHAKIAKKQKIIRNKKEYKAQLAAMQNGESEVTKIFVPKSSETNKEETLSTPPHSGNLPPVGQLVLDVEKEPFKEVTSLGVGKGSITYIEHALESGHLEKILQGPNHPDAQHSVPISSNDTSTSTCESPSSPCESLVVSIHSCGNLTHHGLRSITLNPSVHAVAMVGCCYNLVTERLGPATYKHPQLRPKHPRLEATGSAYDPHGFPMSKTLEDYEHRPHKSSQYNFGMSPLSLPSATTSDSAMLPEKGVRLNVTARMMAVQAPQNWGYTDSESFFTRHFYRALLQRILFDRGIVKQTVSLSISTAQQTDHDRPSSTTTNTTNPIISATAISSGDNNDGNSLTNKSTDGQPLIIGSLRKSAFLSFPTYVDAALRKLTLHNPNAEEAAMISSATSDLLLPSSTSPSSSSSQQPPQPQSDKGNQTIQYYESHYAYARKRLAVIWSLMAFSAGVVESVIVVDRWLWLKEQTDIVEDAWVESVFEYEQSPRNLCVVGVKKRKKRQVRMEEGEKRERREGTSEMLDV